MKDQATSHRIVCDAERQFSVHFYPAAGVEPPYTVVDMGSVMHRMPTTEFIRQMSAVMLDAFDWVGGPFSDQLRGGKP